MLGGNRLNINICVFEYIDIEMIVCFGNYMLII